MFILPVNKKKIVVLVTFALVATETGTSAPLPIPDIPVQTIKGYLSSPPYAWSYAFDIGLEDLELNVETRISLTGDEPGSNLKVVWEEGIENMWSHQYDIIEDNFHYHVNFDVVFFDEEYSSVHHTVKVTEGQGSGNMLNWYTTSAWGESYNGAYVAHEVGHMFGLYDEYPGGAQNPVNPIVDSDSIMGSLAARAKERHYEPFLNWLEAMVPGHEFVIGEYDPDWVIPEPSTSVLFGLGSLIVFCKRRMGSQCDREKSALVR